jgi:hypothetical protein
MTIEFNDSFFQGMFAGIALTFYVLLTPFALFGPFVKRR